MQRLCLFFLQCSVLLLLVSCERGSHGGDVDALQRSRVDALNKASFSQRYNDCVASGRYARRALSYINDSLPWYDDGRLRAWNNLATAYYNSADHDQAALYADSVLAYKGKCRNRDVEQMLARLTQARLLQRNCDIAGSYQILYDLEHSGLLERENDDLLFNLAKSEYYITTTTLNYHYRNKSQYQQAELLTRMEQCRRQLRCDWQEDMSFNYALAYGYYSLCIDTVMQPQYLKKAMGYCLENFHILGDSLRFSTYHLANTYQLMGFILWSRNVSDKSWDKNSDLLHEICFFVADAFGFDILELSGSQDSTGSLSQTDNYQPQITNPKLAYAFLREATALFFLHNDPYQRLGAIVSTGRFCMAHGDTATARGYFIEALADSTMLGVAPKFEAMLYEGFLTSGCATSLDEVAEWAKMEIELLNYIKQNEKADFLLQLELNQAQKHSILYLTFVIVLSLLAFALLVTMLLLRRRTKALQLETRQLQEAKRQDVERIANVETCLSVLRHDITPFVSYLQNDKLPEPLRREVTGQLIRTFENIKNWTNLSIPSGLQFRCSTVLLQEVFDTVSKSVITSPAKLTFLPSTLSVLGDRQLIEIMLRNLVNNAMQHTDSGSVTVSAMPDLDSPGFVCVSVRDTGCGMTPEEVENLFRADKTLNSQSTNSSAAVEPSQRHGSGFGLILCRYIIKKHDDNTKRGCRIWAESQPGKGSSFHFLLASDK